VAGHGGQQIAATSGAQGPMPAQQRAWSDQPCVAQLARRVKGCRREQSPVSRTEPRSAHLAAENLELVPQHQQLEVFHM
jgi:hypothetical protein